MFSRRVSFRDALAAHVGSRVVVPFPGGDGEGVVGVLFDVTSGGVVIADGKIGDMPVDGLMYLHQPAWVQVMPNG